jgi:MFS transporter, ACS family, tartrate transporter
MSSRSKIDVYGVSLSPEARVVRTLLWRLMPFLFLLYVVNYLDRINVGFAALEMQTQLGLSDRVYGLGAGIFFAGYFFFQVPSNLAMARVGARRWMAAIMLIWGVISCSMVLVRTPAGFYELRFLLGAAEAGFFPGIILYLKNWFPATARARAVAWFMTANPLAGVIGGPISGALLEGAPAIALAAIVLLTLKDHPHQATWISEGERLWLLSALDQERQQQESVTRNDFWSAFRSWRIWLLIIVYFAITTSGYGLILWLPTYIHSLSQLSNFGIGLVSVIPYIATAIAMVLVGIRSDRARNHRLYLAATSFSAAITLFVAAQTNSIVPGLAFVSLAMMGTFSMTGPFWATATSLMSGVAAAAGIALVNSFGNLGGFFGPYIIGLKRNAGAGFRGGMLIISALLGLAGLISLLVRAHEPPSSANG